MFRNIQANFWESLVALIILALSCWQTTKSFNVLYPQVGASRSAQFTPLKLEKSFSFQNTSVDNPGCFGYLESSLNRIIESSSYSLKGELFLSIRDKMMPTKIDLVASFNALGQLAASILKITNMSSNITLGFLNVNPIEISILTSNEGGLPDRKKFNIPGPILLKEYGSEFQLEYPAAGKNIVLNLENYPIEQLLNIKLTSQNDAKELCTANIKSSLDLELFALQLKSKLSNLLPQLPLSFFQDYSTQESKH